MIKKLLPIIFFLFLISCSSENENKTSEIELSGEKVKIMNPSTGIDTAGGKISPTIRYKLPDDEIYVTEVYRMGLSIHAGSGGCCQVLG